MSQSSLKLMPTSACALSELALKLTETHRQELAKTLVVLPTQRLGTLLVSTLAKNLTALYPPKLQNLETFILENGRELLGLGEPTPIILSDLQSELLLKHLLTKQNYQHLKAHHAHEILQLFAELWQEGLGTEAFKKLTTHIKQDIYKSERCTDALLERCLELEHLFFGF